MQKGGAGWASPHERWLPNFKCFSKIQRGLVATLFGSLLEIVFCIDLCRSGCYWFPPPKGGEGSLHNFRPWFSWPEMSSDHPLGLFL